MMLSLSVFVAKANHQFSDLLLNVHGNTLFTVAIDHQYYGKPDNHYEISGINAGSHFLEVFEFVRYAYAPHPIKRLLFCGHVNIPGASILNAKIDRWGRFKVISIMPKYNIPVSFNYYPLPAPSIYPMSNHDFNMLRNSVESKSFENTRLQIVKQVLSERYVTSVQVRKLMDLMTFESTKLELAKFAYERVVDREHYFTVNDAFTFESSISELDRYIRLHS